MSRLADSYHWRMYMDRKPKCCPHDKRGLRDAWHIKRLCESIMAYPSERRRKFRTLAQKRQDKAREHPKIRARRPNYKARKSAADAIVCSFQGAQRSGAQPPMLKRDW